METKRIDPTSPWLWHVNDAAKAVVRLALADGCEARCEFNGTDIVATPGTTEADALAGWTAEMDRKRAEWEASDECKRLREKQEREARERRAAFEDAIRDAPALALRDPARWAEYVMANQDSYGGACVRYAETWGRIMQARIARGETIADCADAASHLADDEGITGFMYGCAVAMLAQAWEHGEELRRWHNLKTQVGNEGARANETGGVLNPALLSLREKE